MFKSSTQVVPQAPAVPRHLAIIMDGNGRWATERHLPRVAGHSKGVDAVRRSVETCARLGVEFLTLFAFSSENWRRPAEEVSVLMRLFVTALEREVRQLHANDIRLKVVGDLSAFEPRLQELIQASELKTANNKRLTLTVAANYGGRWDLLQATQRMLREHPEIALQAGPLTEEQLAPYLVMSYAPEPDLFIRTGGEQRISNFLLWQLAYTELYFTDQYWPDFDQQSIESAIDSYRQRERRFGRTSAQVLPNTKAASALG
jgi:undecaprenyl diphosphate synthase